MVNFSDIQDAFLFVNSAPYGDHTAVLRRDTGQILYRSEMADVDEISDEDLDWEMCIEIPHKNDLDLGQRLVFDFIETQLPDQSRRMHEMFRSHGAYRRFKDFLESKGLLERWHTFEDERQEQALRLWCKGNGVELSD